MSKRISAPNPLTEAIERRIILAGSDGLTYNVIMDEMKLGRTCARNHLNMLESLGRVYRVRRTQPGRTSIFHTYHAKTEKPLEPMGGSTQPARRDWLVEAFFGPARSAA